MKKNNLTAKPNLEDLKDDVLSPVRLTPEQQKVSDRQLNEARKKLQKELSPDERLQLRLFQLKFQLEDYLLHKEYEPGLAFGHFLKEYVDILNIKRKDFAEDISIDVTLLSQLINKHRLPPDYIAIRLEIHSNNSIPANYWYKLVEKEKEYQIRTNQELRRKEKKYVSNRLSVSL